MGIKYLDDDYLNSTELCFGNFRKSETMNYQ